MRSRDRSGSRAALYVARAWRIAKTDFPDNANTAKRADVRIIQIRTEPPRAVIAIYAAARFPNIDIGSAVIALTTTPPLAGNIRPSGRNTSHRAESRRLVKMRGGRRGALFLRFSASRPMLLRLRGAGWAGWAFSYLYRGFLFLMSRNA